MATKFLDKTISRFILVGIINTLIGAGTMFLLYNMANCSYWMASVANYLVGGCLSFFLNKYFTFKNTTKDYLQLFKFTINVIFCYIVGYGFAKYMVELFLHQIDITIRENIAMFIGMCIYTTCNYLGQKFWIFR